MGADGGVCWIKCKDEKKLIDLIGDFPVCFETYYDENVEWLQANQKDGFYYTTYNSCASLDFYDLIAMADLLLDPDWPYRDDYVGFTFQTLIEALETSPYGGADMPWVFVRVAKELITNKKAKILGHDLYDWAKQFSLVVDFESYDYEQTWT